MSIALGQDPRQIAEPGRGADPNSVPDLAGAGTSVSATDTRKLGNHHPGDPPILVTISGRMSPTSLGGVLTDTVDVTAALGLCTGGVGGKQLVGIAHVDTTAVTGAASLVGPRANVVAGAREAAGQLAPQAAAAPAGVLPRTGDDQRRRVAAAGVLLGFTAVAARRRRTRRT
ncbi:MAG TPA: hypothetical protein VGQ80_11860 [Acidimicrobiia bacterium]|nr:hypothetical protein [Acidimicrobiia bacterium]